jgi:hypothetical protein
MSINISDLSPVIEPDIESGVSEILFDYGFFFEFFFQLVFTNQLSRRQRYKNGITMFVIFLINLLNYMDRFTIAGIRKIKFCFFYQKFLFIYRCFERY